MFYFQYGKNVFKPILTYVNIPWFAIPNREVDKIDRNISKLYKHRADQKLSEIMRL